MATVVIHKNTGKHYILVGASYSYFKDSRPGFFGGNLFPHEEEGEFELAAVCNSEGVIGWFPTRELIIVEMESNSPKDVLKKYISEKEENTKDNEVCPDCANKIRYWDRECPKCGLILISEDTEE